MNMFKDLQKFLAAGKGAKFRAEFAPKLRYFDGLERLNDALHPKVQKLKVTNISKISRDVCLIRVVSARKDRSLANFRAGQYVGIKVNINGVHTGRAYSLVSSPNNIAFYEIAVKNVIPNGFVSSFLCNDLKVGDLLECTEPLGSFTYNPLFHGKKLLFIAGGCGVTPFISILREIYEKDSDLEVHLLYGCLSQKDMLFKDELERMTNERGNIKVTYVLSEPEPDWNGPKGFITKDVIGKAVGDVSTSMVYIVGPDMMRKLLIGELSALKVARHRIILEVSPPITDITQEIGWPKTVTPNMTVNCKINWIHGGVKNTKEIRAKCTEPLLNSIEGAKLDGLIVDNACRAGECAFCRSHLISGDVFVPQHVIIREVDKKMGYIHPCVSYPLNDVVIELYLR